MRHPRHYFRTAAVCVLLVVSGLMLTSCDDSVTDPGLDESEDPEEVIVTDDAVVVESENTLLDRVLGDTLVFQLSDASPEFQPGNVVVGEEGEGFLRRVIQVDVDGNEAVLITESASLVDVIEQGTLTESFDLEAAQTAGLEWSIVETAPGVEADALVLGIELEDVELPSNDLVDVKLTNGGARFSPDIDFSLGIRRGRLTDLLVAASGTFELSMDLVLDASEEVSTKDSMTLATFQAQPITFFIGFVPVVIVPTLEFVAGYEVGFNQKAKIMSGVQSQSVITAGAAYGNGQWSPVLDRSNTLEARPFDWELSVSAGAKGYVQPNLSFRVYGVAGPFINSSGFLRAETEVAPPSWSWGVYLGIDGAFGGEVTIFDNVLAKYEHTFAEIEWEVAGDGGEFGGDTEATITGEVTDAETGEGIEGATLAGLDSSTGEDLFETTTDAFGEYETTFTVDEALDEIEIVADAEGYEAAEVAASFEEEMILDLALTPVDDPGDTEATISGTITDEETGEGIEGATVTGTDPATGTGLFETETDAWGEYETTFTVEEALSEVTVAAIADGYEATEETVGFAEDMQANLSLTPIDLTPPSGDATVYTASADGEVHKLSPDGEFEWAYTGHTGEVRSVAVDADGFVYTGSEDTEVHKITPDGDLVWRYTGHSDWIAGVAVDAAGFVYTASVDNELHKLTSEGELLWSFVTPFRGHLDVAVDKNGYIYTATSDRLYKLTPEGEEVWRYTGSGLHRGVAVEAEGSVYTTAIGSGGSAEVLKLSDEGELVWRYTEQLPVERLAVSSSGFLHTAGGGEIHRLTPDGEPVWVYADLSAAHSVAVSVEGFVHAAGGLSFSTERLHKLTPDGELVWAYTGHSDRLWDVAVFPGSFWVSQGLVD